MLACLRVVREENGRYSFIMLLSSMTPCPGYARASPVAAALEKGTLAGNRRFQRVG